MKKIYFLIAAVLVALLTFLAVFFVKAPCGVIRYFETIKNNPEALYAFFKAMPKGGELHYHLAGGAYPEIMLELAAQDGACFNTSTWTAYASSAACAGVPAATLSQTPALYQQALRAWSLKDFQANPLESAHDHFFATFEKFLFVVSQHPVELLIDVMQRAAMQQEQYLEIMIMPDNAESTQWRDPSFKLSNLTSRYQQLTKDARFQALVHQTAARTSTWLQQARQRLCCLNNSTLAVCALTVRFQYHILREQPLDSFFSQALFAFLLANQSPDIIAINLVQAEDGFIALRDYSKQMEILHFLHQRFASVPIALHAGELTQTLVTPENTRFHIREALLKGHARRIGHGVDIAHEDDALSLLSWMKKNQTAVEINLTSNRRTMDVYGKTHPLHFYLTHRVPVVLSTDDEGILRTDLTQQYVNAVIDQHLDYPTLRQINRNALTYSFLPGKSLWEQGAGEKKIAACRTLDSASCLDFVKNNEKARIQRNLELKLQVFEKQYP